MEKKELKRSIIILLIFQLLVFIIGLWLVSPSMIESDFVINITKPYNWLIVMFILMITETSLIINCISKIRKYIAKKRDDRVREIYREESRNNKNK